MNILIGIAVSIFGVIPLVVGDKADVRFFFNIIISPILSLSLSFCFSNSLILYVFSGCLFFYSSFRIWSILEESKG